MVKITLALFLLVAVAASTIEAVAVPGKLIPRKRQGFIFLGSTKKEVKGRINGITSVAYEDWKYWISSNSADYAEAQNDCRENGDALLQIETPQELDEVERFLRNTDQTVSLAWVGGTYQTKNESFTWENGEPIFDYLWASGQPSQHKRNSAVAAILVGHIVQLKTQPWSQVTRYICEGN